MEIKPELISPRESQRVLPDWMQASLTRLTGKPYQNQKPASLARPVDFLVLTAAELVFGIILSCFAVIYPAWLPLLIPGWLLSTAGLRQAQVVMAHHCSHRNFSGDKRIDKWLGRTITAILIVREFDDYALDHRIHHSLRGHQTHADETIRFLFDWVGLKVGVPKEENWKILCQSLWSPKFHLRFLLNRLHSNFVGSSPVYKLLAYALWGNIFVLITLSDSWFEFLVAWVIPATLLYQSVTTLRLAVEHTIPTVDIYLHRDRLYICESTVAVFLGESVPAPSLKGWQPLRAWTVWWIKMLFIHGLSRLLVLPGDTPTHDYHSRYPGADDWANAVWRRQEELDVGCPRWPVPYREVWGLVNAIDSNLEALSKLPPDLLNK